MNEKSPPDHRRRYRALDDRRRLGFELERIWARIEAHPNWPDRPLPARKALAELRAVRATPSHAEIDRLDADVRDRTRASSCSRKRSARSRRKRPCPT